MTPENQDFLGQCYYQWEMKVIFALAKNVKASSSHEFLKQSANSHQQSGQSTQIALTPCPLTFDTKFEGLACDSKLLLSQQSVGVAAKDCLAVQN